MDDHWHRYLLALRSDDDGVVPLPFSRIKA